MPLHGFGYCLGETVDVGRGDQSGCVGSRFFVCDGQNAYRNAGDCDRGGLRNFDSFVNVGGKSIVGKGRPTQQEAFFVGGGRFAFNRLANSF